MYRQRIRKNLSANNAGVDFKRCTPHFEYSACSYLSGDTLDKAPALLSAVAVWNALSLSKHSICARRRIMQVNYFSIFTWL